MIAFIIAAAVQAARKVLGREPKATGQYDA
jgi:hypothetical protein